MKVATNTGKLLQSRRKIHSGLCPPQKADSQDHAMYKMEDPWYVTPYFCLSW